MPNLRKYPIDLLDIYDFIHDHIIGIVCVALFIYLLISTTTSIDIPVGMMGYTTDHVYPPGHYTKLPWEERPTIISSGYHSILIEIPTQTNDGMRLEYNFEYLWVKWDPIVFQNNWHHNESAFSSYMAGVLKPTVDSYMDNVDEPTLMLRGDDVVDELRDLLCVQIHPHNSLIHKRSLAADHMGYFVYKDNPQLSYTCYESPGMCNALSSVGVPDADPSTEYNGIAPPYLDRVTNDDIRVTGATATMVPNAGVETQAEMDAIMAEMVELYPGNNSK